MCLTSLSYFPPIEWYIYNGEWWTINEGDITKLWARPDYRDVIVIHWYDTDQYHTS